ncbi:MAG: DUF1538 domain-containing protein [Tissierellia bacterium]|nr:DUF1538 domain-containing protein [Tissierellia bacterium]
MNILFKKFKEVSASVLPITGLVFIMTLAFLSVERELFIRFFIGAFLIIIGLGIFLLGTELGVSQIGGLMGREIANSNSPYTVFFAGFGLGFLVSVAEPDLLILADQVSLAMNQMISPAVIVIVVSLGVGLIMAYGFLRILYSISISKSFIIIYGCILVGLIFVAEPFHSIAFDASGATTGAMTTPFILAMGLGVSMLKGHAAGEKDSFGLVGFASCGPIIAIMILNVVLGVKEIHGPEEVFQPEGGILAPFLQAFGNMGKEALTALFPIFMVFLVMNHLRFKLHKRNLRPILAGMLYTFLGLVLFLVGVHAGFMDLARIMGQQLATMDSKNILLPVLGFILGMVVVLAEPAVYVLSNQVEEVTSGSIPRKLILAALSIGVAFAVSLSMIRILIEPLKLWMILVPGFIFALVLSRKVPDLFVGIAFDSGGVASGPMTATFILALAQGVAETLPHANVLNDGFGIIATVAMTPIIMIMLVGYIYEKKSQKEGIHDSSI